MAVSTCFLVASTDFTDLFLWKYKWNYLDCVYLSRFLQ